MPQTLQLWRTTTNNPPAALPSGALSVELGTYTRLWVGASGGNRLLLSNKPGDTGTGLGDAPSDGKFYGRVNATWSQVAPIASPVLTGIPAAPTPAVNTNTTQLATTAFVATALAPALNNIANNSGRNLLHNPLFNIWQRGTGPFTGNGNLTADRWALSLAGDTDSITINAASDTSRTQAADEAFQYTLANVFTGTGTAANYSRVMQRIENVRRLAGKSVVVSFWAATASGTLNIGVGLVQSFGTGGAPSAAVVVNGQSVAINATWTRYSLTFALPTATGKTLGTNGDHHTELSFWYSSGSTNAVTAGNPGVQSGTIALWGVQLEVGSAATPLEKPDPQQDLAKCQRFYQTSLFALSVYQLAGNGFNYMFPFATVMRAGPTIVYSGLALTNCSGFTTASAQPSALWVTANATATGAAYYSGTFSASADL